MKLEKGLFILTKDLVFFCKYCSGVNFYLEWGTGSTTFLSSLSVKEKVFTIDSNLEYQSNYIKNNELLSYYYNNNKIITFNTGKDFSVDQMGIPNRLDSESKSEYRSRIENEWFKYVSPFSYPNELEGINLDIVLIDGRSRCACALGLFKYLSNDSIVIIHDTYTRNYYERIKDFYSVYDCNFNFLNGDMDYHYKKIREIRNMKKKVIVPKGLKGFTALKKKNVPEPTEHLIRKKMFKFG